MFEFCAEPDTLETLWWFACYLTSGKHMAFYGSFGTVLLLLAVTAPVVVSSNGIVYLPPEPGQCLFHLFGERGEGLEVGVRLVMQADETEGDDLLAELVVQLQRHRVALLLEHADEAYRQFPELFL